MKFKIDLRGALRDPLHPLWLCAYAGAAMLLLDPLQDILLQAAGWGNPAAPVYRAIPPAQPAILAGAIEVADAILQFSGETARGLWSGQVTTALMAMLFSYVVGPALLVWGLRARARYRRQIRVQGGVFAIVSALMLGAFALSTVVSAPMHAVASHRIHAAMMRDYQYSEVLDGLSVELYMMARNAQVKFYRAGDVRGNGHSWLQQGRRGTPSLRLADLMDRSRGTSCADNDSVTIDGRQFSLHIERPDSITLRGSSPCQPPSWLPDSSQGFPYVFAMTVGVTPEHVNMVLMQ